MQYQVLTLLALLVPAFAADCPKSKETNFTSCCAASSDHIMIIVHIFGARETTAKPGFGLAGAFIEDITNAFPSATTEAIHYPATGVAGVTDPTYTASVQAGVGNATEQISAFAKRCPDAQIVLVGYSQGSVCRLRQEELSVLTWM